MVNKKANGYIPKVTILFVALVLVALSFVLANYIVTTHDGSSTSYSVNEDVYTLYNITINNNDTLLSSNITQVNISIWANAAGSRGGAAFNLNFTASNNTNGTSVGPTFFNSTGPAGNFTLSWRNVTTPGDALIMNLTNQSFWFVANASTPGVYNISIILMNATGPTRINKNITLTVNDTTAPSLIQLNADSSSHALTTSRNLTTSNATLNLTYTDNGFLHTVRVQIINATNRSQIQNVSTNITATAPTLANISQAGNSSTFFLNLTGFPDGAYIINLTVNDTYGNINSSLNSAGIQVTIDTAAPTITAFTCTPGTVSVGDTVTCACSGADTTSGVKTTAFTVNPSTTQTGTFSQTCTVTDYVNRVVSSSVNYIVTQGGSSASSGGGSGGSSSTTSWSTTVPADNTELSSQSGGVTKELAAKARVKLKVETQTHYVGVVSLTSTSAVIEISSTPQTVTMNVGDTKKFDVDSDGNYDMVVTLKSIAASKATVEVKYVNEAVPAGTVGTGADTTDTTAGSDDTGSAESGSVETAVKSVVIWVVLGIILVLVIVLVYYYFRK